MHLKEPSRRKKMNPCPHRSGDFLFQELLQLQIMTVPVALPHWGPLFYSPLPNKGFSVHSEVEMKRKKYE